MTTWYVWGDFVHTIPQHIGDAHLVACGDRRAEEAARNNGFDFDRRARIGYEPWAAVFEGNDDDNQRFAFSASGTVRGWEKA